LVIFQYMIGDHFPFVIIYGRVYMKIICVAEFGSNRVNDLSVYMVNINPSLVG
jgi:hypothetical protein